MNILRSGGRVQRLQGDVADDRNVMIIELGDDRTADDESDGKVVHHLEEGTVLDPTAWT